ncbi:hypothetical protein VWN77_10635, partial [Campylobacter coli]
MQFFSEKKIYDFMRMRFAAISLSIVLFFDEPFSALDPIVRLKLQNEIKELSINKSVIFVTHDIDEAINIA